MYPFSIPQDSRASQIYLCVMESNAFIVNCSNPHFDSPPMAFLVNHSVCRQMIRCLVRASEPCLISSMELVKSGLKSAFHCWREQFVQRRQRADRAIVSNIFNITNFVCHCFSYFFPCGENSFCFITFRL